MRERSEGSKTSAERFKQFRETLRLSQKDAAEAMQVTQTRVHYIESGKQDLTVHDLYFLARKYGVNPAYLLGIDNNMINLQYKGKSRAPIILDINEKLKVAEEVIKAQGIDLPYNP